MTITARRITAHPITARRLTARRLGEALNAGFDFYVDSVNGSDANDGLTQETAFATLGKVQTEAIAKGNGVRIGLVAGSEWRESMTLTSLNAIKVCGTGDFTLGLPVVRGDDVITGVWDTSTDRGDSNPSVYSKSLDTDDEGYSVVWEEDDPLLWVADIATCQSTPGSFTISGGASTLSAGTYVFYVHPAASGNPNTNGLSYSYSRRQGLDLPSCNNSTLALVAYKRTIGRNGVNLGTSATIRGVLFHDNPTHDALPASGLYDRCVAWNEIDSTREGQIGLEFFAASGAGLSCRWSKCIDVTTTSRTNTRTSIGGHTGGSLYDSAVADDCSVYGNARVGLSGMADSPEINRAFVRNGGFLRVTGSGIPKIIDCQLIDDVSEGDLNHTAFVELFDSSAVVEGLRVFADLSTGAIVDLAGSPSIQRNVFVRNNTDFRGRGPWDSGASASIEDFSGNIFDNGGWQRSVEAQSVTSSDNNVYSTNISFEVGGTIYTTLAALQSGESLDLNSVVLDPDLTDPANGDFTAQASGLPAGAGLERPNITYTPIPATLAAAEQWIIDNVA